MIYKSVKSNNPCKSVIQTIDDITTKGHGGTIEVKSPPAGRAGEEGEETEFIFTILVVQYNWLIFKKIK